MTTGIVSNREQQILPQNYVGPHSTRPTLIPNLEARLQQAWLKTQSQGISAKPSGNLTGGANDGQPHGVKRQRPVDGSTSIGLSATLQQLWERSQANRNPFAAGTSQHQFSSLKSELPTGSRISIGSSRYIPGGAGGRVLEPNGGTLFDELVVAEEAAERAVEEDFLEEDFQRGLEGLDHAFAEFENLLPAVSPQVHEDGHKASGRPPGLDELAIPWKDEGAQLLQEYLDKPQSYMSGDEWKEGMDETVPVTDATFSREVATGRSLSDSLGGWVKTVPDEDQVRSALGRIHKECDKREAGGGGERTRSLTVSSQTDSGSKASETEEGQGANVESSMEAVNLLEVDGKGMLPKTAHKKLPGRYLVELLLDVAKAVVAGDPAILKNQLAKLGQVASVYGNVYERMSAYFLQGLQKRFEREEVSAATVDPVNMSDSLAVGNLSSPSKIMAEELDLEGKTWEGNAMLGSGRPSPQQGKNLDLPSLLENFHTLVNASPYLTFGQVASNSAILEVFSGAQAVHIIDFGVACGIQWVPLIQALSARIGGPPHVRFTGIDTYSGQIHYADHARQRLESTAKMWQVPFEFNFVEASLENVKLEMLKLHDGEIVAVNCALRLHQLVDESVIPNNPRSAVLRTIRMLQPAVVTLVEQHTNHNSPYFLARFYEALYYYNTVFESLDAAMPGEVAAKRVFEEQVLGRAIVNVVAYEGQERTERQEPLGVWQQRMHLAGFAPSLVSHSVVATCCALLQTYQSGYGLLQEDEGNLTLTWQGRPLLALTLWHVDGRR